MNFDSNVKRKVTEFSVRHGDSVCTIKYEYDIETLEEVVDVFETILKFLTFPPKALESYFTEQ